MQFCEETTFFGKFDFLIIFPSHNQGTNPPRGARARAEGAKGEFGPRVFEDRQRGVENGGVFEVSAAHSTNEKNLFFAP